MVEILVVARGRERVPGHVVGAVPREGEIDVFGDVAAQHGPQVVAHVVGQVAAAVDAPGSPGVDHAAHDVEVRTDEAHGQSVAQVRAHRPVAVHVHGARILEVVVLRAVDLHRSVVGHVGRDVVGGVLKREHPHEGAALFEVRVDVVEHHVVAVRRVQLGVAARYVLRVGDVVDALEVGDRGVLGVGAHEQTDRILAVDVELTHQEVGDVVVSVAYFFGIGPFDLAVERRMLVVNVRHQRVALLRIAESGACAVDHVAAAVGVGELRRGCDARGIEVIAGDVGALVAFLILVGGAVLRADLGEFAHRFGVGDVALERVVVRRGVVVEVAHQEVVVEVGDAAVGSEHGAHGRQGGRIRCRARGAREVAVTGRAVHGDRAAGFAQLGAVHGGEAGVVASGRSVG